MNPGNQGFHHVPFGCYEIQPLDQLPLAYISPDQSTAITAPVFHPSPPLMAFPTDECTVYGLSGEYFSPNMFYSGPIQGYGSPFFGPTFLEHAGHVIETPQPMEPWNNSFLPTDCSDCVFIQGLPEDISKEALISRFKEAGNIKVSKGVERVFLFLERRTKRQTGCATVTYYNSEDARSAIELFHQSSFDPASPKESIMKVRIATPEEKNPFAEKLRRENEVNHLKQESLRQMRLQNRNYALLHNQHKPIPIEPPRFHHHQLPPSIIPNNSSSGQFYQPNFHKKHFSNARNNRPVANNVARRNVHTH